MSVARTLVRREWTSQRKTMVMTGTVNGALPNRHHNER